MRQIEKAYLDTNCREYELTKHISLRLHFPQAFLQLQVTGYCEIEVPEWMFDLDYPGQYMRRIKSVSVTVPSVVGPYTGIHCRVTLLSSKTRIDPRLADPSVRCCPVGTPTDGYSASADDPRVVRTYAATEAIATSGGQNDAGLFELNFRDERYLPFEFAGAVSRWRIELPPENNQWPLDTLSDFVIHLNYTAREGGDVLRQAANAVAQHHLPGDGVRLFDARRDLPDAWHVFHSPSAGSAPEFSLRLGRDMFPFVTGRRDLRLHRLALLVESASAQPGSSIEVQFTAPQRPLGRTGSEIACERRTVRCVASSECPALYHGVLDADLGPLSARGPQEIGTFRFPSPPDDGERLFLLCSYRSAEAVL